MLGDDWRNLVLGADCERLAQTSLVGHELAPTKLDTHLSRPAMLSCESLGEDLHHLQLLASLLFSADSQYDIYYSRIATRCYIYGNARVSLSLYRDLCLLLCHFQAISMLPYFFFGSPQWSLNPPVETILGLRLLVYGILISE
jgi:hypothetical protein